VALIAVSYFTFIGMAYGSGGNFIVASVAMVVVDFVLIMVFIGAQQLKASGIRMRRKIVIERILVFASVPVFAVAVLPCCYFWQLHGNEDKVLREFNAALSNAGEIFNDYESYADCRIDTYAARLDSIQLVLSGDAYVYGRMGFTAGEEEYQRDNMLLTLRTQMFGLRYQALKDAAHEWIRDARAGASVWNVFIVGNIAEIRRAVMLWEKQLQEIAGGPLSNEGFVPEFYSESVGLAVEGIDGVSRTLSKTSFSPNSAGVVVCIILYLMLLLPYMIQRRDGKSVYGLLKTGHWRDDWLVSRKSDPHGNKETAADDNEFTTF